MESIFIPNEILRVFKKAFPQVNLADVEWSWEIPAKIYEADFELDGTEYEVEITVTGHLLLTEKEISYSDAPKVVTAALGEYFPDHAVEGVCQVDYSNGDISYEFALINAATGASFEVHFREDGLFILSGEDL